VVISDVSPNVSGVWEVDHARQIELAERSLDIAVGLLRPGGSFFVKVFQGDMTRGFIDRLRRRFDRVEIVKPPASRSRSAEVYVLASGFHG
jgi:23S rRNA (uridine2552-2'-O)-methyltransferase